MSTNRRIIVVQVFFAFVIILGLSFFHPDTAKSEMQQTLEQRVQTLEEELRFMQQLQGIFKIQLQSWVNGRYAARLYSNKDLHIVFEKDVTFKDAITSSTHANLRIGEYKQVTVFDSAGKVIDSFNFNSAVKPGDLLVAWIEKDKPEDWSVPFSPSDAGFVAAYYWNKSTGLAVGFVHIDGSSQSGVIIVK